MKLSLSLGHVWTGTQADARAAQGGKDFETVEVPTDKPGLIAWLNQHWAGLGRQSELPQSLETSPDDSDPLALLGIKPDLIVPGNPPPVTQGQCLACGRSAREAERAANAHAGICAKADLEDISDLQSLDALEQAIVRRRAQLSTVDPMMEVLG